MMAMEMFWSLAEKENEDEIPLQKRSNECLNRTLCTPGNIIQRYHVDTSHKNRSKGKPLHK
jgi:hypothetical protein